MTNQGVTPEAEVVYSYRRGTLLDDILSQVSPDAAQVWMTRTQNIVNNEVIRPIEPGQTGVVQYGPLLDRLNSEPGLDVGIAVATILHSPNDFPFTKSWDEADKRMALAMGLQIEVGKAQAVVDQNPMIAKIAERVKSPSSVPWLGEKLAKIQQAKSRISSLNIIKDRIFQMGAPAGPSVSSV